MDVPVPVPGLELANPHSGSRTVFRATASSTDGAYVELEQTYRPHSPKPPLHLHPAQDERFEVVSGLLHAECGGASYDLGPGDVLDVPRGTPHQMWGAADVPTTVVWRTSPALRTDQMHCELWAVAAADGFEPDLLKAYEVTLRYAEEFQLC